MSVPEQFIVYQVEAVASTNHFSMTKQEAKPGGWITCTKKYYEEYKGNKRRLAILPNYTAFVRKWFSPANGWYGKIELRDQNKVVFETEIFYTDGNEGWVRTLVSYLIANKLIKFTDSRCGTQWLREEMNIDYFVEQVHRKADL